MTRRADMIGIGLLKTAATSSKAMAVGERVGRGLKNLVLGAADAGGGVAKGVGASERAGKVLGVATLAGGAEVGRRKVKRKIDEAKFRLQYGDQFGGY